MSLIVRVGVNEEGPHSMVTATRQERHDGKPSDDSVNTYDWVIYDRKPSFGWWPRREGTVEHRYGDGSLTLVRKILEAADA